MVPKERRWKAIAEIETLAKSQQEELNSLLQKELGERSRFFESKGTFLPESLCPALSPGLAPTSFQYVIANPEDAQLLHDCVSRKESR